MRVEQSKYYSEINIARGILVVLVVMGHIVTQTNWNNDLIGSFLKIFGTLIYSFHMPAFFFVSGFVAVKILNQKNKKMQFIKKKAKRLLVPYFVMEICYLPFRIILSSMARNSYSISEIWKIFIGENPDGALWFLYVLFLFSVVTCLVIDKSNIYLISGIATIFYGVVFLVEAPLPIIQNFCRNYIFYLLGIIIRCHYQIIKRYIGMIRWQIVGVILFIICECILCKFDFIIVRLVAALTGIYCIMVASLYIDKWGGRSCQKVINYMGNYSMDIYMFSEPVKVVARTVLKSFPIMIGLSLCFVVSLLIPIIISNIVIRKYAIFKKLFLGV